MNKIITLITMALLLTVQPSTANELPSWGMTENQYKLPDFSKKMGDIGRQAAASNWQLKITAPADWHSTIRNSLTNMGERDVQMSLKDSVYQSISITAAPGAKTAKISPSTTNTTVQKQVVIDKPEIDTQVDAPDFGEHTIESNSEELLENLVEIDLGVPTTSSASSTAAKPQSSAAPKVNNPPAAAAQPKPAVAMIATDSEEDVDANRETLRKRHARTKRVEKLLSYKSIKRKDELFIRGSVVLVKRFINQGVVLFFWMKEPYDPAVHKLVEKGSGKYQKDPEALSGDVPNVKKAEVKKIIDPTNLDFIAVDNVSADQDDLRIEHIRNKRVEYTLKADKLKQGDTLYIKNQTVLVERKLSQAQTIYFWLVGDTTITREVEAKGDNRFVIK